MGTEESFEFDEVTLLSPFAIGEPGKRTFFLAIGEKTNWVRVWLEKEHLQALALAIEQLLDNLSQEGISPAHEAEGPPLTDEKPSGLPSAELDIVQIALGYSEGKAIIELSGQQSGAREQNPAEVDFRATLAQLKDFRRRATKLVAAGRPLCPICGGPIDPAGHVCPAEN